MNTKPTRLIATLWVLILSICPMHADSQTSVAGLFPIPDQGRRVWNFNPEWRFHLGDVEEAAQQDFDDSQWEVVSTPHCVKLEPAEASGCRNYQGIAWYRKHFTVTGEGSLIGNEAGINANPRAVEWGSAPMLLQSTRRTGKIHVHAEVQFPGVYAPQAADLDLTSVPYDGDFCFTPCPQSSKTESAVESHRPGQSQALSDQQKQKILDEVSRQQTDFGK